MTKQLSAVLLVLCAFAPVLAAPPTLKEARQRWLKGNYAEAQEAYEALIKNAKTRAEAAVGLSRCHQSQGEYDKALTVVEAALKDLPKNTNLLARKAEVLYLRGRWAEAEKAADAAIDLKKDHFAARWVRAQVYRDRGELKKAEDECRWFVRTYTQRSDADDDIKDPEELLCVGLAGCEHARWNNLSDQFTFILNEVYKDALKEGPDFWPVELAAGLLLLEKYNRGEALDALDKALTINPNCAEALAAKGVEALMRFEVKDAEVLAERALKHNPKLPEALRLRADVHLAAGNAAGALQELKTALSVNPRDERTLARLAACYHLQKDEKGLKALVAEVQKHDSKPAVFYHELGERLEERRRFAEAEKCFEEAAKLRPKMPGPLNNLGLLYMRLGKEAEAEPLLDRGFKADKFNVRVSNMRKVLNHLKKYKTLKTRHFQLRYDASKDEALAQYMAGYLEDIYAELAKKFDYRPAGPILIEVFNNHEMFSGRTVALPDLHTIGACTGRVVTMVSPHGKGVRKPFNWARVLRHELVHIFNLEQTNFLVPHWLTEGLAVNNEGFPRPPIWNELLVEKVPQGKGLLNLDTIDLGFIRPRSPLEWHLAYCQSQLYVQYIQKQHGPAAVGKLLAAYAEGLGTPAALAKACGGVDKATFEKGYRAHLQEVVKPLLGKKTSEKPRTRKQLEAEHKKKPDDPDVAAELAQRLLDGDRPRARKLAEAALDKQKNHPRASYVLARLERLAGNVKEERRLLESALNRNDPDTLVLKALGKLYYDGSDFKKAAEVFELGRKVEPYQREWLLQLARTYAQLADNAKQVGVLKDLVPTDADDFDRRERLARLLLDAGQHAEAEKYARQALEIDVRSPEARKTLLAALRGQGKNAEAARLEKALTAKGGA
jgi:tetratricopeptide (TPR) repeat protein